MKSDKKKDTREIHRIAQRISELLGYQHYGGCSFAVKLYNLHPYTEIQFKPMYFIEGDTPEGDIILQEFSDIEKYFEALIYDPLPPIHDGIRGDDAPPGFHTYYKGRKIAARTIYMVPDKHGRDTQIFGSSTEARIHIDREAEEKEQGKK